jgi:hypothetical protein
LFCGAGGAAVGYARAGFEEIVGVDIKPHYGLVFTHETWVQALYQWSRCRLARMRRLRQTALGADTSRSSPEPALLSMRASLCNPDSQGATRPGAPVVAWRALGHAVWLCGSLARPSRSSRRDAESRRLCV